jgi:hypothetical protein
VGKTTAIRELSRMLANEAPRRVVIVDTSNEIGGDGDVPHPGIGRARRMQVPIPEAQHRVMIEAVENHMPEVVVIDEIGTAAEALAARTIAQRGVQLVATAHGNELENVMKNPSLADLVGGIAAVTLGDDEARRRAVRKTVLERQGPPTFDVAVEMASRHQWRVHLDVGWAVDRLLLGEQAEAEVRERGADGRVWTWPEDASTDWDEDEFGGEEEEGPRPRDVVTQPFPEAALKAARGGMAPPGPGRNAKTDALRIYLFGLEEDQVGSIAGAIGLGSAVAVTRKLADADAVLGLRARLKGSAWVKESARAAGVPIFSVRSAELASLVKALRTVTGLDPSAGGTFAPDSSSPFGADPKVSSSRTLRAETAIAVASAVVGGSTQEEKEALEEARAAIENIVIPRGQPAELSAPRSASALEAQAELVRSRRLRCEVVGVAPARRLRILPKGWKEGGKKEEEEEEEAGEPMVTAAGAGKEFW